MTAFPEWDAPHRMCNYCLTPVPVMEAANSSLREYGAICLHAACKELWAKLSQDDRDAKHKAKHAKRVSKWSFGQVAAQ
jgi:hypothetical protein